MSMMAKKHNVQSLSRGPVNRPGEGSAISVSVQTFISTDGKSIAQLGVDLSQAVVPDRRYAADTCAVLYVNQTVRIIFGQERFSGDGLRSAVAVKMSPRAVAQLLVMIDASMPSTLVQAIRNEGVEVQKLASPTIEPTQATVVLAANLALPAISSMEGCIDFYQASPFALGVAMQSNAAKLAVEAVVRVDLSAGLLLGLIEELRSVRTQFGSVHTWSPAT
jgi:hypothetical protein